MAGSNPFLDGALRVLREVAQRALQRATKPQRKPSSRRTSSTPKAKAKPRATATTKPKLKPTPAGGYPGDYTGKPNIVYQPHNDRQADPGEIVWTWVPYEEDHSEGKDRPVLLIARDSNWLLGLQVTSQDHDRDRAQEARAGRYWVDIGAGEWDSQRRPSEARVNRIVRVDPGKVRRIGATLDEEIFRVVAREVRRYY